jgi:NAD(P)-dependent dehydrogenase (short-subunit alcohol dehydrogenase family)
VRLQDKVVIVTGSTTGIGEAIARRCVQEGARVLVHGRNRRAGEAIITSLGDAARFHEDDLADADAPQRLVDATIAAFGKIDAVCINARAPLLLMQAALPHLEQTRGCVLNIGSVNAPCGETKLLAYSMSKAALMTLTRNAAEALSRIGVRVNYFMVGWVLSENERQLKISEGLPPDWGEHPPIDYVPSGKMTQPEDIAGAAVYWLGDESRPFSGGVIELEQYPVIGRNPLKEGD